MPICKPYHRLVYPSGMIESNILIAYYKVFSFIKTFYLKNLYLLVFFILIKSKMTWAWVEKVIRARLSFSSKVEIIVLTECKTRSKIVKPCASLMPYSFFTIAYSPIDPETSITIQISTLWRVNMLGGFKVIKVNSCIDFVLISILWS